MSTPKHSPMVLAAARALSDRQSAACGVDAEDMWKTYPDVFLEDAQAALDAAGVGQLLEALQKAVRYGGLFPDLQEEARAVIAKATGSPA